MMARAALLAVVLGAGGFLFAASGLYSVGAEAGHWSATRWFLEFSKSRSIATHALLVEAPDLERKALVVRGAGHYETACRRCHGVPGGGAPVLLRNMLPQPPNLRRAASRYSDAELFYIIRNGLKFTGMPGWPYVQREDEVWAMVAFVRRLDTLTPEQYRDLVFGGLPPHAASATFPASPPAAAVAVCARCHGTDGLGREPGAFPKLAGQRPGYLYASLRAYAYGGRRSGIMGPIASELTDDTMRALADYYTSLPGLDVALAAAEADPAASPVAAQGVPAHRVPSCRGCHGPGGTPRNAVYPTLAGQDPEYLVLQLRLFKQRSRGGTAYAHLMYPAADHLTGEQVRQVTRYYGRLPTSAGARAPAPAAVRR